ncbi:MAG: hypothetical protein LBQ46_05775 [Treponema sp.]|jgi:hypothetical protein|nr:hypothetical protein [Treponema sp.]
MYKTCSQVLGRETELLRGVAEAQKQVWDAVVKREWAGFEEILSMVGRISSDLEAVEGERKTLVGALAASSGGSDDETGFYRLIAAFPQEERRELTAKYRELKMTGLRVRINNDNLLTYIAGVRATMSAFIETAFPDRKGRLYSRSGAVVPADMRSMVLNRSF